jgi:hypothetical protein
LPTTGRPSPQNKSNMKKITKRSEIKAKTLKMGDVDYKGHRIGFCKKENAYIRGSWFNKGVDYYATIKDLKTAI